MTFANFRNILNVIRMNPELSGKCTNIENVCQLLCLQITDNHKPNLRSMLKYFSSHPKFEHNQLTSSCPVLFICLLKTKCLLCITDTLCSDRRWETHKNKTNISPLSSSLHHRGSRHVYKENSTEHPYSKLIEDLYI